MIHNFPAVPHVKALLLFIHGGGWTSGSPYDLAEHAAIAAEYDVQLVALGYRLAPEHRWPVQLCDVIDAAAEVTQSYADVPLACGGESAGAHLGLWLTAGGHLPASTAFIGISGLYDLSLPLTESGETYRIVEKVLEERTPQTERELSPIHAVAEGRPGRSYLLHGAQDPLVPIQQTIALAERLKEKQNVLTVRFDPKIGHCLDLSREPDRLAWQLALEWLVDA